MEQPKDKLTICKCCGSNACYESEFTSEMGKIQTWLCMTCGFTTNTTMTKDSDSLKQTLELTAEIIKDNKQITDGLVWLLTVITMPDKGMIFPEPQKEEDWKWTVVKSIPISELDQEKYPVPGKPGEFYKTRMDMEGVKRFEQLDFMDAAEELGMFGNLKNK